MSQSGLQNQVCGFKKKKKVTLCLKALGLVL